MNIETMINEFKALVAGIDFVQLLYKTTVIILSVAFILTIFNLLKFFLGKLLKGKVNEARLYLVKKGIKYAGFVLSALFIFKSLGIDTTAILGAAGIAGIVIGFAAQTTVSSMISGFFLLSEKHFTVGDFIRIDTVFGTVHSVDLLSVKVRTLDNLFVRIPNETIIKGNLINVTRFPIRRLDLTFPVTHKENLEKVRDVLLQTAAANQNILENPEPFFGVDKFDSSGVVIVFYVWFETSNFWETKTSILMDIKKRFALENIEIPYQKIDVTMN